jgi:fatty-acyl-CoA synthase
VKTEGYLARCAANYQPLTPVDFLLRANEVFPDQLAVAWRERLWTYHEFYNIAGRLQDVLRKHGIVAGDVVSIMAENRPEMLAAHFSVPALGAVLNTLNTRLDKETIGYILQHSQSKLLITEAAFLEVAGEAALKSGIPLVVLSSYELLETEKRQTIDILCNAESEISFEFSGVIDEWQPICLNYTSGTTGRPKGVVYHHRGAYLNALGNVMALGLSASSVYLWTLPMFHCNGWCHTWAVTAAGGLHVCLDKIYPELIFSSIAQHGVSHMACAPVVLYMMLNHPAHKARDPASKKITVATGGAAPTSALIAQCEAIGFGLIHLYGLTESFGPALHNELPDKLRLIAPREKAEFLARQGVRHMTSSAIRVVGSNGENVPADGTTLGEILLRGNTLMAGYFRDENATSRAFADGWFHTGDLAVRESNGVVWIKDRAKDVIISGGENISTIEIEGVLHQHHAVLLAAVVAMPDPKWGETPCAFLETKSGTKISPEELIAFCRERLASFKVPKHYFFRELPKTATGKIQKFVLREEAARLRDQLEVPAGAQHTDIAN